MGEIAVRPGEGFGELELGMERGALEARLDCRHATEYIFEDGFGARLTAVRYPHGAIDSITYRAGRAVEMGLLEHGGELCAMLGGLDLFHTAAEELIPALAEPGGLLCDDPDQALARTYAFPPLRLGLWREHVYHPKLLGEPWFQRELECDPEYRRYACFEQVLIWAADYRRPPLEPYPLRAEGGRSVPQGPPPTPEALERIARKYGLNRP